MTGAGGVVLVDCTGNRRQDGKSQIGTSHKSERGSEPGNGMGLIRDDPKQNWFEQRSKESIIESVLGAFPVSSTLNASVRLGEETELLVNSGKPRFPLSSTLGESLPHVYEPSFPVLSSCIILAY